MKNLIKISWKLYFILIYIALTSQCIAQEGAQVIPAPGNKVFKTFSIKGSYQPLRWCSDQNILMAGNRNEIIFFNLENSFQETKKIGSFEIPIAQCAGKPLTLVFSNANGSSVRIMREGSGTSIITLPVTDHFSPNIGNLLGAIPSILNAADGHLQATCNVGSTDETTLGYITTSNPGKGFVITRRDSVGQKIYQANLVDATCVTREIAAVGGPDSSLTSMVAHDGNIVACLADIDDASQKLVVVDDGHIKLSDKNVGYCEKSSVSPDAIASIRVKTAKYTGTSTRERFEVLMSTLKGTTKIADVITASELDVSASISYDNRFLAITVDATRGNLATAEFYYYVVQLKEQSNGSKH